MSKIRRGGLRPALVLGDDPTDLPHPTAPPLGILPVRNTSRCYSGRSMLRPYGTICGHAALMRHWT
jgi:hypothetical protein